MFIVFKRKSGSSTCQVDAVSADDVTRDTGNVDTLRDGICQAQLIHNRDACQQRVDCMLTGDMYGRHVYLCTHLSHLLSLTTIIGFA